MRRFFLVLVPILMVFVSSLQARTPTKSERDREEALGRQYSQDYARQFGRIDHSLRASSTPRDWALAAQRYKPPGLALQADSDEKNGMLLRRAAQAAPNDRFVQWTWANAMPAVSGCDAQHPCPDRTATLAIIEPDNGAAWLPVLNEAWSKNDIRGTDEALSRMSGATRFDDLFVESVAAWTDMHRRYPVGPDADDPTIVFVTAAASSLSVPSFMAMRACYRDKQVGASASRLEVCGRIGRLMLHAGTTMRARLAGRGFLRSSGTMTQADVDAGRAVDWMMDQQASLSIGPFDDRLRAYSADLLTTGSEIRAAELQLQREGITLLPPSGWKSRYERYQKPSPALPPSATTASRPGPAASP